ncbi:heterokaryon incompatibility protein-domain-containing protein [Apiospora sp. TS-2023a]
MVLLLETFQVPKGVAGGLEKLLPSTRHLSATDPRDKIFAFLGLSREVGGQDPTINIIPDYAVNVELLYCYTAKLIMLKSVTLSMLCHVQRRPMSSSLPSWVPDWRKPATTRILGEALPGQKPIYTSPKWTLSSQVLDLRMDLRTLKVYGICFDTIEEVRTDLWLADIYNPGQILSWDYAFLKAMHDFMTIPLSARSHENATEGALALTTTMQEIVDWATDPTGLTWTSHWLVRRYLEVQTAGLSVNSRDLGPGGPAWHYFMIKPPPDIFRMVQPQPLMDMPTMQRQSPSHPMQSPASYQAQSLTPSLGESGREITAVHMAIADKIKFGRAMFRTSKTGRVGSCPEWAQPGDMICYLRGATMPMALRPRGEEFTLIGECYVHGKMSESFQDTDEIQSFILV